MDARHKVADTLTRERVISMLQNELPRLKDRYGVERIILYGSFARGQQKKKSDIDLLVVLRRNPGFDFFDLADRLEELLGRRVDLATFDHFMESFRKPRYRHIAEDIKRNMIYV